MSYCVLIETCYRHCSKTDKYYLITYLIEIDDDLLMTEREIVNDK